MLELAEIKLQIPCPPNIFHVLQVAYERIENRFPPIADYIQDRLVEVRINSRLKRALAQTKMNMKDKTAIIEISQKFLTLSREQKEDVILHELLHVAFPEDGHRGRWRFYALLLDIPPRAGMDVK